MNVPLQACKVTYGCAPISINGTAATTLGIDRIGYHYGLFVFGAGVIGAADFDALALTEADADSGYATISGSTHTAPTQTDDGLIWTWCVDLRKRKRFINVNIDPGAVATLVTFIGILGRAEIMPTSVTDLGVKARLVI